MLPSTKPTALFFAEPDLLTIYLIDELLQKGCEVVIATSDPSLWKRGALSLAENPSLHFVAFQHVNSVRADYVLVSGALPQVLRGYKFTNKHFEQMLSSSAKYLTHSQQKLLLYHPVIFYPQERRKIEALNKIFANYPLQKHIYLGDLYGRGMDYTDGRVISKVFKTLALDNSLPIVSNYVFPLYAPDAADHIVRLLFSYWSTSEQFAMSLVFTPLQLMQLLPAQLDSVHLNLAPDNLVAELPLVPPRNITLDSVNTTVDWIKHSNPEPHVSAPNIQMPKVSVQLPSISFSLKPVLQRIDNAVKSLPKPHAKPALTKPTVSSRARRPTKRFVRIAVLALVLIIGWFVVVPFATLMLGAGALAVSYNALKNGNQPKAVWVTNSLSLARVSHEGFTRLGTVPLFSPIFSNLSEGALIVERAAVISQRSSAVIGYSQQLMTNALGSEPYDIATITNPLSLELDALYKDMSFLDSELSRHPRIAGFLPDREKLFKVRNYLIAGRDIANRLPLLLASDARKTYLVLLQNNSELRPTGGFIGSFALVTFENAHLSDISVMDVYSADGQLKGHVNPPEPIKTHLGEANWYLRDSNWDPDFPTSAAQAEWFLEKELDRKVEGVVGIDLEVLKMFLNLVGEVRLQDFNETVNAQNVYEKIQYEVESTFFPGSQKKASLLTGLTRQLLAKITTLKQEQGIQLAGGLLKSLDGRHIQLSLHDKDSAQVVSDLGWDGAVKIPTCDNCEVLWLGMAEANVGVNKANYYLKRKSDLEITPSEQTVRYSLTTQLTNDSQTSNLNLGGRYKSYLRLLAPLGSTIDFVQITDGNQTKKIAPQIQAKSKWVEAGVFFEVLPAHTIKIVYTWTEPRRLDLSREALLYWRKQAGTVADPITIKVANMGSFSYNTSLETDLKYRIDW